MLATSFLENYGAIVHIVAEFVVRSLELIGILIIVFGSVQAIVLFFRNLIKKKRTNIVISLGKALALALEFKMGAEIINTVIVRDMTELGILAIVVAIRALLAILIHWEIKSENKTEFSQQNEDNK